MKSVAVFSDDIELHDLVNQLEDYTVAYFSTALNLEKLPNDIDLAIFDFDVVPLSLLDDWSQFPRLHLPKIAVVSAESLAIVDEVLDRLDNYLMRPLLFKLLQFRIEQISKLSTFVEDTTPYLTLEFKRWLMPIKGYSEVIQYFHDTDNEFSIEETIRYIKIIRSDADRIQQIVESVVEFMRIDFGKYYRFDEVDIQKLIDYVKNVSKKTFSLKSQKLNIYIPKELPKVLCDQWKIQFVFLAILSNASVFSYADANVEIYVTLDDGYILCGVRDYGTGISNQFKNRIFGKFEQDYDSLHISGHYGLGMSLYLCKQIIEMHGGKIWLESEEGVGTTFYFTLPLAE